MVSFCFALFSFGGYAVVLKAYSWFSIQGSLLVLYGEPHGVPDIITSLPLCNKNSLPVVFLVQTQESKL